MTVDSIDDLKKNAGEADKRLYVLEKKFAVTTAVGLAFAGFLGASGIYYIPTKVRELVDRTAAGKAAEEIRSLRIQAQQDAAQIAKISQGKTIIIAGQCFKPMNFIRCYKKDADHMSSIYEGKEHETDCTNAGYAVEQDILILAKCP